MKPQLAGLPEGSYVHQLYKTTPELRESFSYRVTQSIQESAKAVLEGSALYALLPVSNNNGGGVWQYIEVLQQLSGEGLNVVTQYTMKINHLLAANHDAQIEGLNGVSSQLQALRQSATGLRSIGADTSTIFSKDLKVPDVPNTYPLYFQLGNGTGALRSALQPLKNLGVNLEYINSFPIGNGEYGFSILVSSDSKKEDVGGMLQEHGCTILNKDNIYSGTGGRIVLNQTPATVSDIKKLKDDPELAIVCNSGAVEQNDLKVLKKDIAPEGNKTRFNLVTKKVANIESIALPKVTVIITMKDRVGALYDILDIIADLGLSLDYLHSVESEQKGKYNFYIEMDRGSNGELITLQKQIIEAGGDVRVM